MKKLTQIITIAVLSLVLISQSISTLAQAQTLPDDFVIVTDTPMPTEILPTADLVPTESEVPPRKNLNENAIVSTEEVREELPGEVLGAKDIFNEPNSLHLDNLTEDNSCVFTEFSKIVRRGNLTTFNFKTSVARPEKIIQNEFVTGSLPDGATATVSLAASKVEKLYEVSVSTQSYAQIGSFTVPLIYTQTDTSGNVTSNICQFNLIVTE